MTTELPLRLRSRVLAATSRPATGGAAWARWALLGAGATAFAAWLAPNLALSAAPATHHPWAALILPAAVTGALTLAITRRRGMLGLAPTYMALCVAGAVAALVGLAMATSAAPGHFGGTTPAEPHPNALATLGVLTVLLTPIRMGDPGRLLWYGAALGATAGAWLSVSCAMTCANVELFHLLVAHGASIPLLAALGGLVAHWIDGRRFQRPDIDRLR